MSIPFESENNLKAFKAWVELCEKDKVSEIMVRSMIEKSAQSCPIHILVAMGRALVTAHGQDLKNEARDN